MRLAASSTIQAFRLLTTFVLLTLIPFAAKSTHIVGGNITYVHNGGQDYTLTLIIYKDCDPGVTGTLDSDYDIFVYYDSNGDNIVDDTDDRITVDMDRISNEEVPSVLDTCVEVTTQVCVEEHIYTEDITLPVSYAGYHIIFERYARNAGISNLDFEFNDTGEGWYTFIPSPTTYIYNTPAPDPFWFEDFEDLAEGDEVDNGATAWEVTVNPGSDDHFEVRDENALNGNKLFEGKEVDGLAVWTSEYVHIDMYPSGVNLSAIVDESGNMGNDDYIDTYYLLDQDAEVQFTTNGNLSNDFDPERIASETNVIGDSVAIRFKIDNDRNDHYHRFDDISITAVQIPDDTIFYGNNSAPVFDSLPPPYLCAYKSFSFDHAATDPDGDSLVYSLCTPYDDWQNNSNNS